MGILNLLFGPPNIAKLKRKQKIGALVRAVEHKNSKIAEESFEALQTLKKPAIEHLVGRLLKCWGDSDRLKNAQLLQRLGWSPGSPEEQVGLHIALEEWITIIKIGEPAVDPLVELLMDDVWEPELRIAAAAVLSMIGGEKVLDALMKIYEKGPINIVRSVQDILLYNVGSDAAERLGSTVENKKLNDDIRVSASQVLPWLGEAGANVLLEIVSSGEEQSRNWAALSLAGTADPRAGEALKSALPILTKDTRQMLEKPLQLLDDPVEKQIEGLSDRNPSVRAIMTMVLGNRRVEAAAKGIAKIIQDETSAVFAAVLPALANIGGKEAQKTFFSLIKEKHWQLRIFALMGLSKMRSDTSVVKVLSEVTKDTDLAVRAVATLLIDKVD